jgi:outer membrane receptor protein involved in Fe transport
MRLTLNSAILVAWLLLLCRAVLADESVSGVTVPDSRVDLLNVSGSSIASAVAGADGSFILAPVRPGSYLLRVGKEGYAVRTLAVRVPSESLRIELTLAPVRSEITVTAARGLAEDPDELAVMSAVLDRNELHSLYLPTLGNAFMNVPGVMVQQSGSAQVSPFLRGLTGYHVLNLVDGVRFNNSTFRSGPNQYLAFLEPSQAERVESTLGPAAAQYGSDSLGGTIQLLTIEPRYTPKARWHGEVRSFAATADVSGGINSVVSHSTARSFVLVGGSTRKHNDLRAGGGMDSRSVFYRLFGLRDLRPGRLQDTAFAQHSLYSKASLSVGSDQTVSLWFQRSGIRGSRGYKDLLGGLGRLRSDFDPQDLHLFYTRYEKIGLGPLDSLSLTFSVNNQRDGSLRQGLRFSDSVTRDDSSVRALGYAAQATSHIGARQLLVFGGEMYDERLNSIRFENLIARRPLYPDGSRYRTAGLFAQDSIALASNRLRALLSGRVTSVRYRTFADDTLGVSASRQSFSDATFGASLVWQLTSQFGLHALVSRGFRAPNANDLGAVGLNDLGYEIPSSQAGGSGAFLSTSAGEGALSTGRQIQSVGPEHLFNQEVGLRFQSRSVYARVQLFDAELLNPIVRRTLLFPADNPPSVVGGLPVTPVAQTPEQERQRVVGMAASLDPRALKAFVNDGHSRYYGTESLIQYSLSSTWSLDGRYSFIHGRELNPNRPVRRLPPQQGYLALRHTASRLWWETSIAAAGAQKRLSGGDIDDERIGASRRRRDIADFFNGLRVAPLVDSNGVFTPSGETLDQIRDRVLPIGAVINGVRVANDDTRVPLYASTAGWLSLDVRAGFALGEQWNLWVALTNVLDRNFRVHGSGIDAPGRNAYVGLRLRF